MCKIVFNSIFRQGIKNTLKCLSTALILIILHWTHNALKCFTKCPQDLLLIIIQGPRNSNRMVLLAAAACLRAPSSVFWVYCKWQCKEVSILGSTKWAFQEKVNTPRLIYLNKLLSQRFKRLIWDKRKGDDRKAWTKWWLAFLPQKFSQKWTSIFQNMGQLLSFPSRNKHNFKDITLLQLLFMIFFNSTISFLTVSTLL